MNSSSLNSTLVHDPTDHRFLLSQIILSFFIVTPAVLSNVVLLVSIYRDPDRNRLRQSPVTLLVVNLSACDLLAVVLPGTGSLYYNIVLFNGGTAEDLGWVAIAVTSVSAVANIVSSCSITAMSLDRLFAVSSPLHYKVWTTKTKIKVFLAVCWVYALLFSCLAIGVSVSVFVLLYCHLHVSVPLIIQPVVYWRTLSALRLHNKRVADGGIQGMDLVHRNRERKMISAFLLVLVMFHATFMPQVIAQNMFVFQPSCLKSESFLYFLHMSNKIVLVNCSLNPFIYAWRIPKYRQAFKAVFCGCGFRYRRTNTVADGLSMMMRGPPSTATERLETWQLVREVKEENNHNKEIIQQRNKKVKFMATYTIRNILKDAITKDVCVT